MEAPVLIIVPALLVGITLLFMYFIGQEVVYLLREMFSAAQQRSRSGSEPPLPPSAPQKRAAHETGRLTPPERPERRR